MEVRTIPAGRSPWLARLNNKRKGTRSLTEFRYVGATSPNRSIGESEVRIDISIGKPPVRIRFRFGKGKHLKPGGGSQRKKAHRRQQYMDYWKDRQHAARTMLLKDILDRPKQPMSMAVKNAPNFAPTSHFGVLDREFP